MNCETFEFCGLMGIAYQNWVPIPVRDRVHLFSFVASLGDGSASRSLSLSHFFFFFLSLFARYFAFAFINRSAQSDGNTLKKNVNTKKKVNEGAILTGSNARSQI